ncbi:MAG TPA: pseudouridine synthase [Candidatus Sumerlaeota bacterium]|nr:pseudouridine synthase [Candidatus Sumerlaeota bacterium]
MSQQQPAAIPQKLHRFAYQPSWQGKRLKEIVRELLPALSSRNALLVVTNGLVSVEGGAPLKDVDATIGEGSVLLIDLRHGVRGEGTARHKPLRDQFRVVHDDEDLVVVAKEAFTLVQPTDEKREDGKASSPLIELLKHFWKANGRPVVDPILVQRLDLQTSGLLVIAKNVQAARELQAQLMPPRSLKREYIALVAGDMIAKSGIWRSMIGDGVNGIRRSIGEEGGRLQSRAQLAVTHFETLKRYGTASKLRLRLETGRTHQIRIHAAESGHPVLGDPVYTQLAEHLYERGAEHKLRPKTAHYPTHEIIRQVAKGTITLQQPSRLPGRIALHAIALGFIHPRTQERMEFHDEPPQELMEYERYLERLAKGSR